MKPILTESSCLFFLLICRRSPPPFSPPWDADPLHLLLAAFFTRLSSASLPSVAHRPPTLASVLQKTLRRLSTVLFIISAPSGSSWALLLVVGSFHLSAINHFRPFVSFALLRVSSFTAASFSPVFFSAVCGRHSTSYAKPSCCCFPGS